MGFKLIGLIGFFGLSSIFVSCEKSSEIVSGEVQAVSVSGENLYSLGTASDSLLNSINEKLVESPNDIKLLHAKAREFRNHQRYKEAIELYTKCIELDPDNPIFYRRRGHRYISIRDFEKAIIDLEKSQEMNRGIIRTPEELQKREWDVFVWRIDFEIWYHLGFAYYLNGDYLEAELAFEESVLFAKDDNSKTAGMYWYYLTLRRRGNHEMANVILKDVSESMQVSSNSTYLSLLRFFKGDITESEALDPKNYNRLDVIGYGVAAYREFEGDRSGAIDLYKKVIDSGYWPGFGYIASEVALAK